jgi:hypothetical protein
MMRRKLIVPLIAGMFAASLVWLAPRAAVAADDEVDVIVNKANTVGDLGAPEVKKLFMGDKSVWPSGKRVTILMLAQGQAERSKV